MTPALKTAVRQAMEWLRRNEEESLQRLDAAQVIHGLIRAVSVGKRHPLVEEIYQEFELIGTEEALLGIMDRHEWPKGFDARDAALLLLAARQPISLNDARAILAQFRLSGGRRDMGGRMKRLARLGLLTKVREGRGGPRWVATYT